MFKNLIIKFKNFNNIKLRFDLPPKKKIIQYDELHSSLIKKIIKSDLNIIPTRKKDIYFSSNTVACADIPSSRPSGPIFSVVVAFTES